MLSASQIAGFLNQLFLQNKLMKQPYFLYVDTNSQRIKDDRKFLVRYGQKWMYPICFLDSKIDCISKNELIELTDFLHVGTNSRKSKGDSKFFRWVLLKMGVASLVIGI